MTALDMSELVAEDKAHRLLALLRRESKDIGVEHDEVATEESCRKSVENSAGLDHEDVRYLHVEATRVLFRHRHQLRELALGDTHSVAADLADHQAVKHEIADGDQDRIEKHGAADRSAGHNDHCQGDVQCDAD